MKTFIVGGAVRDIILGHCPNDIDFLVVGATEEDLKAAYPGAKKVGSSFPVYLFNGEEYALARVEKKSGPGHKDFSTSFTPDVTLEQDLLRRDLTINALAMCPENNFVLGASQGLIDIREKVLRHNNHVAFKEDPLRVFRVARFAAQLEGFTVAPETLKLMSTMKEDLSHLSSERVFIELQKALSTQNPRAFFEVLKDADCLETWFPELKELIGISAGPDEGKHKGEKDCFEHTMNVIDRGRHNNPVILFSCLCHDLGKALSVAPPKHHGHDKEGIQLIERLCDRLKVPTIYRKSAILFCEEHIRMHKVQEMRPGKAVRLVSKAEKVMPDGLRGFLCCSINDGMLMQQATHIYKKSKEVFNVRLPKEYYGRGKACADILLQMQVKVWRSL